MVNQSQCKLHPPQIIYAVEQPQYCILGKVGNGFVYDPATCECKAKCGDGLFIRGLQKCDDGNNKNGDGCDSNCVVQQGFKCKSMYFETSICQMLNSTFKVESIDKVMGCNRLKIIGKFDYNHTDLLTLDFRKVLTVKNLNLSLLSYAYSFGYLQLHYEYFSNLNGRSIIFEFNTSASNALRRQEVYQRQFIISVEPASLMRIDYYPQSVYTTAEYFRIVCRVCIILAFITFLVGFKRYMFVTRELFVFLQFVFLSLLQDSNLNPLQYALALQLRYSHGPNIMSEASPLIRNPFKFGLYSASDHGNNNNLMLLFPILVLIIFYCMKFRNKTNESSLILTKKIYTSLMCISMTNNYISLWKYAESLFQPIFTNNPTDIFIFWNPITSLIVIALVDRNLQFLGQRFKSKQEIQTIGITSPYSLHKSLIRIAVYPVAAIVALRFRIPLVVFYVIIFILSRQYKLPYQIGRCNKIYILTKFGMFFSALAVIYPSQYMSAYIQLSNIIICTLYTFYTVLRMTYEDNRKDQENEQLLKQKKLKQSKKKIISQIDRAAGIKSETDEEEQQKMNLTMES